MKEKIFVIRKYIKAKLVADAVRKEKKYPVDDCWVDEEWRKNSLDHETKEMGFKK